jgi:RNA polymerase sigma factor (sigma-70 family)
VHASHFQSIEVYQSAYFLNKKRKTNMEKDELSDEFLMDAIAGRAMWALERLHDRYSKRFSALAYRMTADKMVTEELVQDTFLAIWQSATSYDPRAGPVRGWLFSIIYHRTLSYLRIVQRSSALQQVPWHEVEAYECFALSDVWGEAWSSEQIAELHTCLKQLSPVQRKVIELAYFEGWTHTEIAQHCQLPIGTVKARIRLGVHHLRRALEQAGVGKTLASKKNRGKAKTEQAATVVVQMMENGCPTGYGLCGEDACRCFGYTEWERLIEQVEAFEFRGAAGCFIARKEKRAHGCAYWYAYTWGSGGRRKTYLGRPAELTLARLEAMARKLYEV